jgi:predicted DNA-binding transcriptional regulator AlpA
MSVNPEDLIDRQEVADIIGLAGPDGLSVYRKRYKDFPEPVIEKGRTVLWLRQEVQAWAAKRPRRS